MATSGSAIGGNDVFNGKTKISWWLLSQDPLAGAHGRSTVRWAWNINWASGDNCHRIEDGAVTGNSVSRYSNSLPHVFNAGHVHTGDWPSVSSGGGGFATGTYTIDHDSAGAANIVLVASHHGSSGATSTASLTTALTAIPQTVASPTSLTATRITNNQANLAWTNNSTGTAPYANIKVYRATDGGAYALIATLGVVTSYSDTTINSNHKYVYRVSAVGANTVEVGYATATAIFTTPAADSLMTATKLANGDIRVDWQVNSNYQGVGELQHDIYDSPDGTTYTYKTSVFGATATWTHTAPSTGVTHRYKTITFPPSTSLFATSNISNIITLLSTAGAPTGLSPAGTAADATEVIVFTWTHNPTDGTPQSKYQLQYKIDAGSFVTVGPTTSGVSSYSMPASTLTNAHTITWHVATAGQNGTIGAYSADSVFTTSDRPTSVISTPSGGSYSFSTLTVNWTYFQAQSSAQTSWHAYLWKKGALGDYSDAILLEEQSGSGTTASVAFATALLNGVTYGVRVYVTSATGLTSSDSGTEREEFTVAFLPPAAVTLVPVYDPDSGRMTITINGDDAVGGVTVDISSVDLQRQVDGGDWITWVTGIPLMGTPLVAILVDSAPTVHGTNSYRAIVHSALPSSVLSAVATVVTAETQWGFLSTGNDFAQFVRMRARLGSRVTGGRDRSTYQFAGRTSPVELSGEATPLVVAVAGTLYPPSRGGLSSEPQEVEALAETTGIVLWRDYSGRRVFASLSGLSIDYSNDSVLYPVGFNLERVAYDEDVT